MRTLQEVDPSPEQLTILTDAGPGFRLIRGAAGSGKTTAALLRLRQLCNSRRQRRRRQGSQVPVQVLVLTFNRTLRGYINQLASEQVSLSTDIVLTVETFAGWARNLIGYQGAIDESGEGWIRSLLRDIGVPAKDEDYFVGEITYVLGRFPPNQREEYLGIL